MKSKEWSKKISIALITAMIVSLMAPVLTWAAMQASFTYNTANGYLMGSVYVQDPNSVTVSVYKEDGTVSQVTYSNQYSHNYDDQNNQFTSITYSVYLGEAPANVKVQSGSEVFNLNHFDSGSGYITNSASSVTLDVYRMQGNNLLPSTVVEDTYIAAGSDLFNFTPNVAGADVLEFTLPHNIFSKGTFHNVVASDFVIENVTVGQAVYENMTVGQAVYVNQSLNTGMADKVRLLMDDEFIVGDLYKVKLSSAAVNKIQLPSIEQNHNSFTAVVSTGTMSGSWYSKKNSLYFNGIQLTATPVPGGGFVPPANSDKETVNESSLKNGKDGKVAIDIANGTKQVLLPANAAKALGENSLELKHEKYTLEIPSEVLAALAGLVSEEDLLDAEISFTAEVVADQATMVSDINSKGGLKSAKVKSAGEAIDFTLSLITKDGKEHKLEKFSKALKLKLKLSADANAKLAGIYYVADDNSLEFVGGKVTDGEVNASLTHFSTYAPLEYDKTFEDVSSSFWASDVIKNMSAKHVIAGVTDSTFVPNQDVTRAQFAAFLVRALELKASGAASFTDVATGKWYAAEVAAAAEAGIVSGRSDKIFAPEDVISREEMAIMIVRAHEYMTGKKVAASEQSAFADSDKISVWAQSYVDAAYDLGYIQGRGNNLLAPSGQATRAESAQVVSLLVK